MDTALSDSLVRSLRSLEELAEPLDVVVAGGGKVAVGGGGTAFGPRPPVGVALLDLKLQTERLLDFWCSRVASVPPGESLGPGGIATRAGWLRARVGAVERASWGAVAAEEIIAQAYVVGEVVDPSGQDHSPLEYGSIPEIASWCRFFGRRVSERSLRRWCNEEEVPAQLLPDGRYIVRLADVLEYVYARQAASHE